MYQKCSECGEVLELNSLNFHRNNWTKKGFRAECSKCSWNRRKRNHVYKTQQNKTTRDLQAVL